MLDMIFDLKNNKRRAVDAAETLQPLQKWLSSLGHRNRAFSVWLEREREKNHTVVIEPLLLLLANDCAFALFFILRPIYATTIVMSIHSQSSNDALRVFVFNNFPWHYLRGFHPPFADQKTVNRELRVSWNDILDIEKKGMQL